MAVLVFMYHRTPSETSDGEWDVPMPVFCDQIRCLLDDGYEFIRFSDALEGHYYGNGTYISLTFDDGHESNLDAFDFLQRKGIVPTAFIISEWSQRKQGTIPAKTIAGLADHCEFGGHGATHTALTDLSEAQLVGELKASKSFLEDTLQRTITTMSVPGGRINDRVVDAAIRCKFRVIGNSVELINSKPCRILNRLCVRYGHGVTYPTEMARKNQLYWLRRRARLSTVQAVVNCVGESNYLALRQFLIKR